MLLRLKIKFVCTNMAIVTAMLLVIFGTVIFFTAENLNHECMGLMDAVSQRPFLSEGEEKRPGKVSLPHFSVRIEKNGDIFVDEDKFYDLSDEDFVLQVIKIAVDSEKNSGYISEYGLRFGKFEKTDRTVLVFVDITGQLTVIRNLIFTCFFIGFISFFAFLGISFFLANWAIKPVEKAWNLQKQFVADASHELKTPLTVIMTNAELLREKTTEEDKNRFSENILSMSQRMRGLVENLLQLARADSGNSGMHFEKVNFSDIIFDAVLPFEPVFFENEKTLFYRIDRDIILQGSSVHLKQVADILLDNALKYSFEESTVRVELFRKEKNCILSVKSIGEHIEKEELENIFKRFYRIDKARSSGGSHGLGLSIAESIVTQHKGKIWAKSNGSENIFYVILPIF